MAIIATNAEREEKASAREDRGTSARVFTVGGIRGVILGRRYEKPRGIEVLALSIRRDRHNIQQE
jgi:hypothetical protein